MADIPNRPRRSPPGAPSSAPGPFALVALAFTTLFVLSIPFSAWVYYTHAPGVDFASFWAAGDLAGSGRAALAYNTDVHRAVEETVANMGGSLPFSYPPPFLFVVAPFAFRPFWLAYLLWMGFASALYFVATRGVLTPRYAFAHPATLVNSLIGQNGLLTASIFLMGATVLAQQPFLGGAIFGLLVIKPQLACLLPIAFAAGREWRALAGAALSSLSLLALAGFVFGIEAYAAFAAATREFASYMAASRWNWTEFASVFGFARSIGVPQSFALAVQAIAAAGAIVVTWRTWAAGRRQRVAVLAAATLLVPPYLFTYDSLLLILPLACFIQESRLWRAAAVWTLMLVPLGSYFGLYSGPNPIPLAAILSLWWLHSPALATGAVRPAAASSGA